MNHYFADLLFCIILMNQVSTNQAILVMPTQKELRSLNLYIALLKIFKQNQELSDTPFWVEVDLMRISSLCYHNGTS